MPKNWSIRLSNACLIGAGVGAIGLSLAILYFTWADRNTHAALTDQHWYDHLSLFPAVHGLWAGGLLGTAIGFSLWVAFTSQPVHPLYTSIAGGVLGVALGTLIFTWYWGQNAPSSGSGLGGAMHAVGMAHLYLMFVLPGCAILGVVCGLVIGVVKRVRRS